MRMRSILLATIGVVALLIPSSLLWYRGHYSMHVARSFDAGSASAAQRVLIATQGSPYKDALVAGLVRHLRSRPVYIGVIDVSALPGVKPDDWTAIVLIHTWEYSQPQADALAFVERLPERRRLVVVTTSGSGRQIARHQCRIGHGRAACVAGCRNAEAGRTAGRRALNPENARGEQREHRRE